MAGPWNIDIAGQYGTPGGPPGSAGSPGPPGAGYIGTSTSNFPIATGPITITTQSGLAYQPGGRVRLSSNSVPSQWMEGVITSYIGTQLAVTIDLTNAGIATTAAPVLLNYLGGLTLSNDTTSPNTVLDIATGSATSDDNSTVMSITVAGFTKNCNAPWAVGSGNGGLSQTALVSSTWYHVFVIMNPTASIVDVFISSSISPALPTGYTKKRRIGSFKTNASSQILPFIQNGDLFLWSINPAVYDVNNGSLTASFVNYTVNVPTGVRVIARLASFMSGNTQTQFIRIQATDDNTTYGYSVSFYSQGSSGITGSNGAVVDVLANTSGQVKIAAGAAIGGFYLHTDGWIDYRGK